MLSDYLHHKLESIDVDPALNLMQGPLVTTSEKAIIFLDDCRQAVMSPFFRAPVQGAELNTKNTVRLDL